MVLMFSIQHILPGCYGGRQRGDCERVSHPAVERAIDRLTQWVTRFSLKFQRIVQDEQEANFITRLHVGELAIVPWYDSL